MEDKYPRIEPRADLRNTGVNCDYEHIEALKEESARHERSNRKIKKRFKRVIRDQVEAKIMEEKELARNKQDKEASDAHH